MELSLRGTPGLAIAIDEASQVGQARRSSLQMATQLGFDDNDSGRVALVATELATNVIKHGRGGSIYLREAPGRQGMGVELTAVDRGPGFDLAACLQDGFSTSGTNGIGLGAVQRQAQVMDAYADHRGSVVMARIYPRQSPGSADIRFGVVVLPIHGEHYCGDGWALAMKHTLCSVMVVDGLGHGEAASIAAVAAQDAFLSEPLAEPAALMGQLHQGMTGTRGGAVAIARLDLGQGTMRFAGIGNISAGLVSPQGTRGLASHPGIVGSQFRRAQAFDFSDIIGQLLIMHSDGLQSRWRMANYPGLSSRHPAVIAAVLHRDFSRNRDDATVVVIALERMHG
ncbi:MAG TPA: ATP-binding protein [Dyella sp.]|uniref:ATP-binding protein n=1 Tax=Dyella sp. TaxID=1869338 RepID=UPI002D77B274|nr:ATP-binding protein [Dyella sp.]HET6552494.1 ATP-binding protein [Dyella sp.]